MLRSPLCAQFSSIFFEYEIICFFLFPFLYLPFISFSSISSFQPVLLLLHIYYTLSSSWESRVSDNVHISSTITRSVSFNSAIFSVTMYLLRIVFEEMFLYHSNPLNTTHLWCSIKKKIKKKVISLLDLVLLT